MPFALSAGQPRGWAPSCRAQARGGRRLAASIAVDGRAALPSGGWVAAGCHLSSSNVPGWVVSQPWWLVSVAVAFRRRFESPRAYRPAPRKRGACAADERRRTHDATPAAPSTASPGAHCCAYAPGNAPPAADFPECAPCGHWPAGHTPRNLTGSAACLPSAYGFATRWPRRGLCASRGATGASPHPPALPHPGKGARGHVRCGGERAAGDGGPGIQAKHTHARKNPQAHRENTPPEGAGKFPLDKLSAVVVQLSTRGRIGSGGIRCPPASARESRSDKSPEGLVSLPGFYSTPHCPPARPSPHPMRLTQQNLLILLRSSCGSLVHRSDKRPRLGVSPLGLGLSGGLDL